MHDNDTATKRPSIAALWREVEAADAAHKAALDDLNRLLVTGQWITQAQDKAREAHRAKMAAVGRWWTACNEDDSEDAAEERVRSAAAVMAERQAPSVSTMDLAWDLEDAGLLGSVRG